MRGDRYGLDVGTKDEFIIEDIDDNGNRQVLISNPSNFYEYQVGLISSWTFNRSTDNSNWTYLGNFVKSQQFNNLYEKLANE